jgi:hypothetical protein
MRSAAVGQAPAKRAASGRTPVRTQLRPHRNPRRNSRTREAITGHRVLGEDTSRRPLVGCLEGPYAGIDRPGQGRPRSAHRRPTGRPSHSASACLTKRIDPAVWGLWR